MKSPWHALAVVGVSTLGFGLGGGLVGLLLAKALPSYYDSLFNRGLNNFDAVQTGVGLGISQGLLAGIGVGLVIVALFMFRPQRQPEAQ